MARRNWSHDELILAFNLYCKTPFGKIHTHNPAIIALAKAIGRTPSAVSWKLANFARLDPTLGARSIRGATHGANEEKAVWNEFRNDWEKLAFESERLLVELLPAKQDLTWRGGLPEGREREALVRARTNQGFFRAAVLASYGWKCCITGLAVPDLLTASHIVPWAVDVRNRTNPANGLCLNAIHDRAFDRGLLTVTPELRVRASPRLGADSSDPALHDLLTRYDGLIIRQPRRFAPDPEFLRYHNEKIFLAS